MTDSTISDAETPPARESLPAAEPSDEGTIDLARIAWLVTVVAFVTAGVILMLRGDDGYAWVTFAVAASAAINLF